MMRLQNDDLSLPARALVPLLRDLAIADAGGGQGAGGCCWRGTTCSTSNSVAAGIYEMFQRRLLTNVRDLLVPAAARGDFGGIGMKKVIELLQAPDGRFGDKSDCRPRRRVDLEPGRRPWPS